MRLLIICSNNFSRSPLAAAILTESLRRENLQEEVSVSSAGAFAGQNPRPVERRTQELARANSLNLSDHRTREIAARDLSAFDLFVVLDDDSYWQLKRLSQEHQVEVEIMRFVELFGDSSLKEIADPVLGESDFPNTFKQLTKGCEELLKRLRLRMRHDARLKADR